MGDRIIFFRFEVPFFVGVGILGRSLGLEDFFSYRDLLLVGLRENLFHNVDFYTLELFFQ